MRNKQLKMWILENLETGQLDSVKTGPLNADAKLAGCIKKIRRPNSMILLRMEICADENLSKSFQKVIIEAFKENRNV